MTVISRQQSPDGLIRLENIGTALRKIISIVSELEEVSLRQKSARNSPRISRELFQDFDLILQSLTDLAVLLEDIGQTGLPNDIMEQHALLSKMNLGWLRDVVGGIAVTSTRNPTDIIIF